MTFQIVPDDHRLANQDDGVHGHSDGINDFACYSHRTFRVNGVKEAQNFLLSCSEDKTVRMWDVCDLILLRTFIDDDVVECIDVCHCWEDPSVDRIIGGGFGKTIKLWDPKTGEKVRTITTNTPVSTMATIVNSYGNQRSYIVYNDDTSSGQGLSCAKLKVTKPAFKLLSDNKTSPPEFITVKTCTTDCADRSVNVVLSAIYNTHTTMFSIQQVETMGTAKQLQLFPTLAEIEAMDTMDTVNTRIQYYPYNDGGIILFVSGNYLWLGYANIVDMKLELSDKPPYEMIFDERLMDITICCTGAMFDKNPMVICGLPNSVVFLKLMDFANFTFIEKELVFDHSLVNFESDFNIQCLCASITGPEYRDDFYIWLGHEDGKISTIFCGDISENWVSESPMILIRKNKYVQVHQEAINCIKYFVLKGTYYVVTGSADSTTRIGEVVESGEVNVGGIYSERTGLRDREEEVTQLAIHVTGKDNEVVIICCTPLTVYVWSVMVGKTFTKKLSQRLINTRDNSDEALHSIGLIYVNTLENDDAPFKTHEFTNNPLKYCLMTSDAYLLRVSLL